MGIRDELQAMTDKLRGIRLSHGELGGVVRQIKQPKAPAGTSRKPSLKPRKDKTDGKA